MPLNRLVALAFVELMAEMPLTAVNVQLVACTVPLDVLLIAFADKVQLFAMIEPVELFSTPGRPDDIVATVQVFKVTVPVEVLKIPRAKFPPPVIVQLEHCSEPVELAKIP